MEEAKERLMAKKNKKEEMVADDGRDGVEVQNNETNLSSASSIIVTLPSYIVPIYTVFAYQFRISFAFPIPLSTL